MRRKGLCLVFFLIALLTSNVCLAGANPTESGDIANDAANPQISENTQEVVGEQESADDTQEKKELLPLGNIFSSILKMPGNIIDGIGNIPLDDMVSSTLKIPGDAVNFVVKIPYGDIAWSTLEVSAQIIEEIADNGFLLGFMLAHHCHH